jgi:type VI secretion system secreted protein VgrG
MKFSQAERQFRLESPFGEDVLLFGEMEGEEGLSRLFRFRLDLLSERSDLSFKDILGKSVTLEMELPDGKSRYVNGIVSEFYQLSAGDPLSSDNLLSRYRAIVVPALWLLTQTADCRIFQNKSVPDIVEKILEDGGVKEYKLSLKGSYPVRDYCVQYRETDFNFMSRLLEEEGIFYYFQHETGKHTLILADDASEHKSCPHQKSARCKPHEGATYEEDMIDVLQVRQEIRVGKYTLNDFNFEMPNTSLRSEEPSNQKLGPGEREVYDYPGFYGKKSEGDRLAKIRMQEEEARMTTLCGVSNCRAFVSGYKFKLEDFYRPDMTDKEYVLTEIRHTGSQTYTMGEAQGGSSYRNEFVCMPSDVPFRPARITPKPFVRGVQTAIVVGPAGEEIYPDKYGRVKVQFHWDREGKKDDKSSCWVRVSQLFAGAGWGAMFIPRIGQEVIVDFLEGDPDRPMITGRVYHGTNNPPYSLPDEKTKSTIKTQSSPGGGGFNELRFEDKKGNEQIFVHAQKNLDTVVKANETRDVGGSRTTHVKGHFKETIDGGEERTVQGGSKETISGGVNVTISGGETRTISGGIKETISGGETRTIDGGVTETVTGGVTSTVTGAVNQTVSGGVTINTPAAVTVTASGGYNVVTPSTKTVLDVIFDQHGASTSQMFALAYAVTGLKAEYAGVSLSFTGVGLATMGLKLERVGVQQVNTPVELKQCGSKIGQVAASIVTAGLYVVS